MYSHGNQFIYFDVYKTEIYFLVLILGGSGKPL